MEKKYHRDLEYRLLNGSLAEAEEEDVANLLRIGLTEDYRVVTCYLKPENYKDNFQVSKKKDGGYRKSNFRFRTERVYLL